MLPAQVAAAISAPEIMMPERIRAGADLRKELTRVVSFSVLTVSSFFPFASNPIPSANRLIELSNVLGSQTAPVSVSPVTPVEHPGSLSRTSGKGCFEGAIRGRESLSSLRKTAASGRRESIRRVLAQELRGGANASTSLLRRCPQVHGGVASRPKLFETARHFRRRSNSSTRAQRPTETNVTWGRASGSPMLRMAI